MSKNKTATKKRLVITIAKPKKKKLTITLPKKKSLTITIPKSALPKKKKKNSKKVMDANKKLIRKSMKRGRSARTKPKK